MRVEWISEWIWCMVYGVWRMMNNIAQNGKDKSFSYKLILNMSFDDNKLKGKNISIHFYKQIITMFMRLWIFELNFGEIGLVIEWVWWAFWEQEDNGMRNGVQVEHSATSRRTKVVHHSLGIPCGRSSHNLRMTKPRITCTSRRLASVSQISLVAPSLPRTHMLKINIWMKQRMTPWLVLL